MSTEFQLLIDTIKALKPEDNIVKDYVFPIATAFFSSLLGGAVAYFTFKHQDAVLFEKEKLNTTNKWTILAIEALHSLQAIKQNYFDKIKDDPYQRMQAVPPITGQFSHISESLCGLSYISSKIKPGEPEYSKWSQIPLVQALFSNYNLLISTWEKRNELDVRVKSKLLATYSNQAFGYFNTDTIRSCIDPKDLVSLIDLTERVINLTDDLIIELIDFLENFPVLAESRIKMKTLKNYGTVLKIQHTQESMSLHKKCPEANYELVSDIFGYSAAELKNRYKTGYESHNP